MRNHSLLRASLLGNAVFSTGCAVTLILVPGNVSAWIGLQADPAFLTLGIGLLIFAAGLTVLAASRAPSVPWLRAVILADFAWVAITAAVLLSPWTNALTERGLWTLVVVAQFVLLWGVLQSVALRIASPLTAESVR